QSVLELPGNEPGALAACARGQAAHPFTAEPAPEAPLLFVAGERDAIAEGVEELAAGCGAPVVRVPGRTHANAVSARAFKEAVRDFLAREPSGAVSEPQGGGPRAEPRFRAGPGTGKQSETPGKAGINGIAVGGRSRNGAERVGFRPLRPLSRKRRRKVSRSRQR